MNKIFSLFFLLHGLCFISDIGYAEPKFAKLYQHLTGVPILKQDARYKTFETLFQNGDLQGFYKLVKEDPYFYRKTGLGLSRNLLQKSPTDQLDVSDFDLTILGTIRDSLDARTILTSDFVYLPAKTRNPYFKNDRLNYNQFIAQKGFVAEIKKFSPQWDTTKEGVGDDFAGVLTSAGFSSQYYKAGTNRLAVSFATKNFLCAPIDFWKNAQGSEDYIRRDVDRAPGGKPQDYKSECRTCHAPMDAMGGAFAMVDDQYPQVVSDRVAAKMNANSWMYPLGAKVANKSWENFISPQLDEYFGWRSVRNGESLHSYAEMLAESKAYSTCLVKHSFSTICRHPLDSLDDILKISDEFEKHSYDLNKLFIQVISSPKCLL